MLQVILIFLMMWVVLLNIFVDFVLLAKLKVLKVVVDLSFF